MEGVTKGIRPESDKKVTIADEKDEDEAKKEKKDFSSRYKAKYGHINVVKKKVKKSGTSNCDFPNYLAQSLDYACPANLHLSKL